MDFGPIRKAGCNRYINGGKEFFANAFCKNADLSNFAQLLPDLSEMEPAGILDMDVDVNFPWSDPAKCRLKGSLTLRDIGFRLPAYNLTVKRGKLDAAMSGARAQIKTMTLQANAQHIALSGQVANPLAPVVKMRITSPNLNIDRLLAAGNAGQPPSAPPKDTEDGGAKTSDVQKPTGRTNLPPLARKLTADLQIRADRGVYKGLAFENMKLDLAYKHGKIKSYLFNIDTGQGNIEAEGSADLRNPEQIAFAAAPAVSAVRLERMAPPLEIGKLPFKGPVTLTGWLRGQSGSKKETLQSLTGRLNASVGPGKLTQVGRVGRLFAKVFSAVQIRNLFSGRLLRDLTTLGIRFQTMNALTAFENGRLDLNDFQFVSDAMIIKADGTIDLINQKLDIEAALVPIATVDRLMNYVPIVGRALARTTM